MKRNNIEKIAIDLRQAGIVHGDTLLVHSSFKAFQGEAQPYEIIEGFIKAVGEEGTLLFPTLSYELVNKRNPVFDHALTSSCVGFLSEFFRTNYAACRSFHPTHSVAGCGKNAKKILDQHHLDRTPAGRNSPFYLNRVNGGKIVMLGCGLRPNTTLHAVEEEIRPPYLFKKEPQTYRLIEQEQAFTATYEVHNFDGYVQRYDRISDLLDETALIKTEILKVETYVIGVEKMWELALEKLRDNALYFVDKVKI